MLKVIEKDLCWEYSKYFTEFKLKSPTSKNEN